MRKRVPFVSSLFSSNSNSGHMKNWILSLTVFISLTHASYAQVAMVSDIYGGPVSSIPDFLYATSDKVYFTGEHGIFGVEMWEHTTAGSVILNYEVNSSGSSSTSAHFAEFNGKIYFQGYENVYGNELYEYDGLTAPVRISDMNPGSANSIPSEMTVLNGKLYFSGVGPGNDYELFVYDGINPPSMVSDINTTGSAYVSGLKVFNGKLYFSATNGGNGYELYEYDGVNPPAMLIDINSGPANSFPKDFTVFNNKLYFNADNGINGAELWMYDGTNNPSMVVDMIAGSGSFDPRYFYVYNGALIFSGIDAVLGNELWQYDGVNTPTMIFDINTNPSVGLHNSHPRHFIEYNGILYFRATDELHGRELWGWNGATDPELIEDINPGTAHSSEDWNLNATKRMVVFNGNLVFAANNGVIGEELFKYTGCLVNASVNQTGSTLSANQTGDTYQWVDCTTGTAISGETNQTFTPATSGDYSVVITDGLCIDTSDCFTYSVAGIENYAVNKMLVYPNPAQTNLTIQTTENILSIKIFNSTGALVRTENKNVFSVETLPVGIYLMQVQTENEVGTVRFIKD